MRASTIRIRALEVPPELRGRMCVDAYGMPRYWATIWSTVDGAAFSEITLAKYLRSIEQLYRSVEAETGSDCLDRYITGLAFDQIENSLTTLFVRFRNKPNSGGDANWRHAIRFLRDCLLRISKSVEMADSRMGAVEYRLRRLDQLYTSLQVPRKTHTEPIRALPAAVIADLYDIITPDSHRNPFRTMKLRWRNFALFLLLLHEGLRLSEVLSLSVDAIKNEWHMTTAGEPSTRYWLDVAPPPSDQDTRPHPASLKNDFAVRQIPVSAELEKVVRMYTENYRGRCSHPFLFASQAGAPMGKRNVNDVCRTLSSALDDTALEALRNRRKKNHLTPHDLRHTCAVMKLAHFRDHSDDMGMALQKLRLLFGWSPNSTMPQKYAKAYFEDQLATIWQDDFSEHVDVLRNLEAIT